MNARVHDLGRNGVKLWRGGDIINSIIVNTGADAAVVFDNPGNYRMLNTLVANHAPGAHAYSLTAAYDIRGPGLLQIVNCIFYNNGGTIFAPEEFRLDLRNNIFFGSESGIEVQWGERQFGEMADPLRMLESMGGGAANLGFIDPRLTAPGSGDFTLGMGSPAIDRGLDADQAPALDLVGNPRSMGAGVDLGPFERPQ
jgi:hypothetical protein